MLHTGSYSCCRLLAAPTDFLTRGKEAANLPSVSWVLAVSSGLSKTPQMPASSNTFEQRLGQMERAGAEEGFSPVSPVSWQPGLLQLCSHTPPDKLRRQFQRSASLGVAGAGLGVSEQPASPRPLGAILPLAVALAVNLEDHKPPQLPPPASCRHHHHLLTHTRTCCVVWAATSGVWNLSRACRGLPAPTRSQSGAGRGAQQDEELPIAEPPEAGRLSSFPAVI